jgi:oligopeptide transport system substrate-binding protein
LPESTAAPIMRYENGMRAASTEGFRMTRRRALAVLLWLAMIALSAGGSAWAGGTLRRVSAAEPETLDPLKAAGLPERMIALDLFEGLVTYAGDGALVPGVAASWDVAPDGRRWTFHLRHDAKWSNGDPVTAEDFLYTLRRLVDPATAAPNAYGVVMIVNAKEILTGQEKDPTRLGVRALDPYTLVIDLREPVPFLPSVLAGVVLPVNRKAIEAHGTLWTRPGNIVGNGPFVLSEWTPQAQIVLDRNPLYGAADRVQLDQVQWIVAEDSATALKRYRAGEIDISSVPPPDLDFVRSTYPGELHQAPQLAVEYLVFNLRAEPFASKPKLREALALVIDRDTLNNKVDPAGQVSTNSFVPPFGTDYQPQVPAYAAIPAAERLATARRLMAEAGYPAGTPLKLTAIYHTDRFVKKRLLSIAAMWKEALGVELTIQNREWQIWLSALRQGDFQLSWDSITSDIPEASDFMSGYRSTAGELNDAGYDSPAFDKLIDEARAEIEPKRRIDLLERAERQLLGDTPLIPLDNPVTIVLVSPRVSGWQDNVTGIHLSRYLGIKAGN